MLQVTIKMLACPVSSIFSGAYPPLLPPPAETYFFSATNRVVKCFAPLGELLEKPDDVSYSTSTSEYYFRYAILSTVFKQWARSFCGKCPTLTSALRSLLGPTEDGAGPSWDTPYGETGFPSGLVPNRGQQRRKLKPHVEVYLREQEQWCVE